MTRPAATTDWQPIKSYVNVAPGGPLTVYIRGADPGFSPARTEGARLAAERPILPLSLVPPPLPIVRFGLRHAVRKPLVPDYLHASRGLFPPPRGQQNGLAPAGGAVCAGTMASTSGYSGNRLPQGPAIRLVSLSETAS
jgi:hypothetical protein